VADEAPLDFDERDTKTPSDKYTKMKIFTTKSNNQQLWEKSLRKLTGQSGSTSLTVALSANLLYDVTLFRGSACNVLIISNQTRQKMTLKATFSNHTTQRTAKRFAFYILKYRIPTSQRGHSYNIRDDRCLTCVTVSGMPIGRRTLDACVDVAQNTCIIRTCL